MKRPKNGRKRVLGTESDEHRPCGWREIRDDGDWRGQQWSRGSPGWEQPGTGSTGSHDCADLREYVREEPGSRGPSQEHNRQGSISDSWILDEPVQGESFRPGGVDSSSAPSVTSGVLRTLNWAGGRRGGRSFGATRCPACCHHEPASLSGSWRMSLLP